MLLLLLLLFPLRIVRIRIHKMRHVGCANKRGVLLSLTSPVQRLEILNQPLLTFIRREGMSETRVISVYLKGELVHVKRDLVHVKRDLVDVASLISLVVDIGKECGALHPLHPPPPPPR
jgi:hypothetical protein